MATKKTEPLTDAEILKERAIAKLVQVVGLTEEEIRSLLGDKL